MSKIGMSHIWAVCSILVLSSCGGESTLRVDLRTDFVPGVEFYSVETRVAPAGGVLSHSSSW